MSSSTFVGNPDAPVSGFCPAPPPPPPPPAPGQVPVMRINTAEAPALRRPPQISSNDPYEPPAAIQNAMLTKDKKPFTYTPGMGGKLDLSQIRSPRMARRVAKNANDEGIEGPPKAALEAKPAVSQNAGNLFVQPQVAVPVFPTNVTPQPLVNRTSQPQPPLNRIPSNASEKTPEVAKGPTKVETKITPIMVTTAQPSTPDSNASTPSTPSTPPQVTLTKAPTPWLQNKNKPQEELPEWAKRANASKQQNSPPDSPPSASNYVPQIQQVQQPTAPATLQRQQSQQRSPQQQAQPQQFVQRQFQNRQPPTPTIVQQEPQQSKPPERVIPIRIEDRPSVFAAKQESGHHQFKQPSTSYHQQRWGGPNQNQTQVQSAPQPQAQQQAGGAYIIPIMVEGEGKRSPSGPAAVSVYQQPNSRSNPVESQLSKGNVSQKGPVPIQQFEGEPVQSRSFRVLQKITDTDSPNDLDAEQLRKLQLTEDDRVLMNKFREQVDGDTYLHQEEDPRYRGAAIPSRAFRFLQNMTDSGEVPVASATPRGQNALNKKQNRNSKSFEETQANLPPSEQQVQEPRKYMGSAIPSRSFRILQAMTAPESVGPDSTDY